jgi:hypothetical protein
MRINAGDFAVPTILVREAAKTDLIR